MTLSVVPLPSLTGLAIANPTPTFVEAFAFSADSRQLLVHVSWLDSGNTTPIQHHGVWLYDFTQQAYTASLNQQVSGTSGSAYEVTKAVLSGSGNSQRIIALAHANTASDEPVLVQWDGGVVTSTDLLTQLTGESIHPVIQSMALSSDGRFLALQTDTPVLAPDNAPDTNEVADIYLIDLLARTTRRITLAAGAETPVAATLGSVYSDGATVSVAFVSNAAFTRSDKNSNTVSAADPGDLPNSDAYLWSSGYDSTGLTGTDSIQLLSIAATGGSAGTAAGYVSADSGLIITSRGAWFSSTSPLMVTGDTNNSSDVFLAPVGTNTVIQRLSAGNDPELDKGASLAGASLNGQRVALLTNSPDALGQTGVEDQLLLYSSVDNSLTPVSSASSTSGNWSNDLVLSPVISPSGNRVAFTSAATNLPTLPEDTGSSYNLYVQQSELKALNGHAYFWNKVAAQGTQSAGHVLLNDVTVQGAGQSSTTDATGSFSLPLADASTFSLSASRVQTDATELANIKAAISLSDVLDALKIYLGKPVVTTSAYRYVAADLDANGKVELTDVLNLLKTYLNKPATASPSWAFVPEDQSLATLSKTSAALPALTLDPSATPTEHLVAVLRGDVNGSWKPASTQTYAVLPDTYFTDPSVGIIGQHPDILSAAQFGL